MRKRAILLITIFFLSATAVNFAYPIDGYSFSGIKRLLYLSWVLKGKTKGKAPIKGARKSIIEIQLNLVDRTDARGIEKQLPEVDEQLQKALNPLFPRLHESYSIALLDMTEGREIRYASRKEKRGYQPGSVGKLAVVTALFYQLEQLYPHSFDERIQLMKSKKVRGGKWTVYDEHTIPIVDIEKMSLLKRRVKESDVFSLFEWTDYMMSVSNNGAASVVWREVILMKVFGDCYPFLTDLEAEEYFTTTNKTKLADIAITVISDALAKIGIEKDEWRLGSMFTRGARSFIPRKGGSIGTPEALMKFMVAMERGIIVDPNSSLEIKRLMYMTDRRIRYAANKSLAEAAVYFKSGSLYKCKPEAGYQCVKYKGNVSNFMNSVAIVEHPDGRMYMVALMSNVLKKNSNWDHNKLAAGIDKLIHPVGSG